MSLNWILRLIKFKIIFNLKLRIENIRIKWLNIIKLNYNKVIR